MKITVILKGDIETCCSYFLADEIEPMVRQWIGDDHTLQVIDREDETGLEEPWSPDEIGATAIRYFRAEAYPLVYIGDTLVTFGALPSRKNLTACLAGETEYGVTPEDIVAAAQAMKLPPPDA
jgi:hypothetical protein